jgi:hypothetical protein
MFRRCYRLVPRRDGSWYGLNIAIAGPTVVFVPATYELVPGSVHTSD